MKIKNYKNYRLGFDIGGTFTDIVLYNIKKKEIDWAINTIKEALKEIERDQI